MQFTQQRVVIQGQKQGRRRSLLAHFKRQLIVSVGLLIFCLLISSIVGSFVAFNQQQLGEQKVALHDTISTLLQSMIDQETGLRGYIATDNSVFLAPLQSGKAQYTLSLRRLKNETASTDFHATAAALARVEQRASIWSASYATPQLANMESGNIGLARSNAINTQGKRLFDSLRDSVTQLQQSSDSDLTLLQLRANMINLGLIGGVFLLTLVVVIWLWRTFSIFSWTQLSQLNDLKAVTAAFGGGDLAVRVEKGLDSDFDELGQTFNIMAAQIQEQQRALRDRDILEHVSQLNVLLSESLNLDELMQSFFRRTFQLLDIQVGVLYRYDAQKEVLELSAARGLQIENLQTTFVPGEGLIGRVAQDREPLLISNQTQAGSIFQVKTMLGNVVPAGLYHLPLAHGNDLLGVLVIGSIYPLSEQSRNVLLVMSSNLASTIRNVQAYEHIQQQARELAERSLQQERSNQTLRQQRDELSVLNSALEEANRVRSQFLSTMSHELRTPLTSIIGFSQILLRPGAKSSLSRRQIDNLERILKNSQHLLLLINDVLDLAKIEAGRMDVDTSKIDAQELLDSIIEETRSIAIERALFLHLDIEAGITTLETDARKLRQILLNLVSNALKFTEKGGVTVSAARRSSMADEKEKVEHIVISVQDTGIGIAPEKQAHIFDAFYQVDSSNSRNYGGTGLGLSIVRELTTLLGGKIEFQSQPGQGSTFRILLPMHIREQRYIQDLRLNTFRGQGAGTFLQRYAVTHPVLDVVVSEQEQDEDSERYLVVAIDDNPDVLRMIASILEQSPYRMIGIQDSTQAITVVQELHPQAVTLDIMMPGVNGWQILHRLKSNPDTASIPVILLTVLEDRSAGYVLGADEYLVKPVERNALLHVLRQLTASAEDLKRDDGEDQAGVMEQSTSEPADQSQRPVLLMHNEQDIHRFIKRLMKEIGHQVQDAHDDELFAMIEEVHPDLLMLFINAWNEQR